MTPTWQSLHAPKLDAYEEEPDPFTCPRCKSTDVDYLQDAGAWWRQQALGEQVVRTRYDVTYYDSVLEIECRGCGHRSEHPSRGEWG